MEIISIVIKYIAFFIAFIAICYLLREWGIFRFLKYKNILFYKKFRFLFYDNKNITRPLYINIFIAFLLLLIVFSTNIYFFNLTESVTIPPDNITKPIDFSRFGQFGDFMGGILNPIFMFLTLIALIITIVLQRKELKLARKEYSKTSIALNTQAIENTFFNTINLHHRIVENLNVKFSDLKVKFITDDIRISINHYGMKDPFDGEFSGIKVFDEIITRIFKNAKSPKDTIKYYEILQNDYSYILGHYFRNLYQALKLIDKNDYLKKEEKKKYTSILRAQLSSNELSLLFLNCLNNMNDRGEFKKLLIKYKIFEHLNITKQNKNYILSGIVKVSEEMVLQYFHRKEVGLKLDLSKSAGGAFGKNNGVPYDILKIKNRELRAKGSSELYYNED